MGVLANGGGPAVLLRCELDALPLREETGAPYASTATAADASGHQVPAAWLIIGVIIATVAGLAVIRIAAGM